MARRNRNRLAELLDELRDELLGDDDADDDDPPRRTRTSRRRRDDSDDDVITLRGPAARKLLGIFEDDGKDPPKDPPAGDGDPPKDPPADGDPPTDPPPKRQRTYFTTS